MCIPHGVYVRSHGALKIARELKEEAKAAINDDPFSGVIDSGECGVGAHATEKMKRADGSTAITSTTNQNDLPCADTEAYSHNAIFRFAPLWLRGAAWSMSERHVVLFAWRIEIDLSVHRSSTDRWRFQSPSAGLLAASEEIYGETWSWDVVTAVRYMLVLFPGIPASWQGCTSVAGKSRPCFQRTALSRTSKQMESKVLSVCDS
ncbi:uncharacterized protein RCC_11544 [Ramularia collo-cygni]|uniref:Uncharacterized protein n=1 Tax=Ramularia collo-cygni TaxID=112498 RepID=A0A2D3VF47_9PEZI|nr:uncharacterized protein RCC_11544 [Ramularia collo-cygni]CZT25875.1 uncharacterized protein RCC_11544 [Ramularia collo-cygni]